MHIKYLLFFAKSDYVDFVYSQNIEKEGGGRKPTKLDLVRDDIISEIFHLTGDEFDFDYQ